MFVKSSVSVVYPIFEAFLEVKCENPAPIGMGIQAAMKDKFSRHQGREVLEALIPCKFNRQ